MTREERENALHCLKVMIDEEVCEECNLYGTTGTDHCEADCVRVAIKALEQEPQSFEWCDTCKEYDQDEHCCHRWSKAIRDTVEEMKQEYIKREVLDKLDEIITDALDKSTDQKESQTLRWVLDKISEVVKE